MTIEKSKLSNKFVYASIACWLLSLALPVTKSDLGYQILLTGFKPSTMLAWIFFFPFEVFAFCTNFVYFIAIYRGLKGKNFPLWLIFLCFIYNLVVLCFKGSLKWQSFPGFEYFSYLGVNFWMLSFILLAVALFFRRKL